MQQMPHNRKTPVEQHDEVQAATTDVVVSHLLRLPSASPSRTRCPQAAMVVLCTSPLLRMPQLGFLGLQSVTCTATTLFMPWGLGGGGRWGEMGGRGSGWGVKGMGLGVEALGNE